MEAPLRILVVDDDLDNLRDTCGVLEQAGYAVGTASNGAQALAAVHDALPEMRPDLVLLVCKLADMDSLDVCRQIKAASALANIFVVLTSAAVTSEQERIAGLESGADGYIVRPISNSQLAARVAALARALRLSRALRAQKDLLQAKCEELNQLNQLSVVREAALSTANSALIQSRRAALNLIDDAIEARQHLEDINLKLRNEVAERRKAEAREAARSRTLTLLAGGASLDEILDDLVHNMEAEHPGTLGSVLLLDADGTHLLTGAAPSLPGFYNQAIDGMAIGPMACSCGKAAFTGARVVVADIQTDPLWVDGRELAAAAGLAACWSEPIFDSKGQVLGTFAMYYRQVHTPGADELGVIAAGAQLAALAIERNRAQASHRESEQRLAGIVDSALDAIITVDAAQRIVVFNAAAGLMFRCNSADAIGQPIERFIPQRYRASHAHQVRKFGNDSSPAITRRTMGQSGHVFGIRADGEEFPVETSISHAAVEGQRIFSVTLHDISERITAEATRTNLEAQLRESQKMDALGTLAGGIAHDFNNILGAIMGNLALAREEAGESHPVRESLDEIVKAGRRAKALVDQILTFSRRQTPELTNQLLQPQLQDAIKLLRATVPARVHFELVMTTTPLLAQVNASQLSQVLINLGTNAWHALKDGAGRIDVTLDEVQLDEDSLAHTVALPPGRYARIRVRDDGCGMDKITQARVFEPFFTTRPVGTGTGLGLAVVHGIVKAHHGAISVTSAPGEGSIFEVLLPASDAQSQFETTEAAPPSALRGEGRHVLYLDDDEAMVLMVTRMLIRRGFRVSGFEVAEEALAAVRADPDSFDLVVSDFNMPKASGLDVARAVAHIRPGLPVVITSGYITDALREGAHEAGVRHLVYKPNSVEELAEAIARVLEPDSG